MRKGGLDFGIYKGPVRSGAPVIGSAFFRQSARTWDTSVFSVDPMNLRGWIVGLGYSRACPVNKLNYCTTRVMISKSKIGIFVLKFFLRANFATQLLKGPI